MSPICDNILRNLITEHPLLQAVASNIQAATELTRASLDGGGTLFVCGNGGSAADAEHIAGELLKGFCRRRPLPASELAGWLALGEDGNYLAERLQSGLRCMALTGHPSLATAVANDIGADLVFAQQLNALGRAGDVLLAISTSGNARNVNLAALVARRRQIKVLALTGEDGGRLRQVADVMLAVPGRETYRIQELHLPLYHAFCAILEADFFPV